MGKSFKVTASKAEPIPFEIELESTDGTVVTHEFHAKPVVAGAVILDLVASGSLEFPYQAAALRHFFKTSVVPDEVDKFVKLLDESDPPIEMDTLNEISAWLIEQYGNRPTSSAAS